LHPVIYLDAFGGRVKDGGHVRNKAAHLAVRVDVDGIKHVLGIWVQTSEALRRIAAPERPQNRTCESSPHPAQASPLASRGLQSGRCAARDLAGAEGVYQA
jgi:hypothetical protein